MRIYGNYSQVPKSSVIRKSFDETLKSVSSRGREFYAVNTRNEKTQHPPCPPNKNIRKPEMISRYFKILRCLKYSKRYILHLASFLLHNIKNDLVGNYHTT